MKHLTVSLMIGLSLLAATSDEAQTTNRGQWLTLAPVPSLRQEISTAVLDGKIYVIAGFNSSADSTNTVEVYDPRNNTWASAAPLPITNNHNAAAVAAGKLAFFGSGLGADATDIDGNVAASVQATIDGAPATVQYAGRAPGFTGLNQFNVVLPAGIASGTHNVPLTRNGITSNAVTMTVR